MYSLVSFPLWKCLYKIHGSVLLLSYMYIKLICLPVIMAVMLRCLSSVFVESHSLFIQFWFRFTHDNWLIVQ